MMYKSAEDQCKEANDAGFISEINFLMWIGPSYCLVLTGVFRLMTDRPCESVRLMPMHTLAKSRKPPLKRLSSAKIISRYLHAMLEHAFRASSISSNLKEFKYGVSSDDLI